MQLRHDWTATEVEALFEMPFTELVHRAQCVHREHHAPATVQLSTLLSIKTGACPEDCAYCPQSVHFDTGLGNDGLMPLEQVLEHARAAQSAGATRFCMGAAYRSPKRKDLEQINAMVRGVRALGMETCATLGMLTPGQATELKDAGLDRTRIVKAEIVVTDHDQKPAFDEAWASWMPDGHGPVRSFVQSIMPEGDLVEIIVTAALP